MRSQVPPPGAAHQAGTAEDPDRLAILGQADASGVEQRAPVRPRLEREDPGALLEERPLLIEEEGKAGQVHLLLIRLHGGEVRVGREVQGEVGRRVDLHVRPDFDAVVRGARVSVSRRRQLRDPIAAAQRVGGHIDRASGRDPAQPHVLERRDLGIGRGGRDGRERPAIALARLVGVDHQAHDHRAVGPGLEAQARERDAHLSEPTLVGDAGLEIPEGVPGVSPGPAPLPRSAFPSLAVAADAHVHAGPQGKTHEADGVLVVVERVQEQTEAVVPAPAVPCQGVGAYFGRIVVEEPSSHVDGVVIIRDTHLDAPVAGAPERRFVHGEGERLDPPPGVFVADPVQEDGALQAGQLAHAAGSGRFHGRTQIAPTTRGDGVLGEGRPRRPAERDHGGGNEESGGSSNRHGGTRDNDKLLCARVAIRARMLQLPRPTTHPPRHASIWN